MNIIHETDPIIESAINRLSGGKEKLQTITTAKGLSTLTEGDMNLGLLIEEVWQQIVKNWETKGRPGGDRNWRWALQTEIDPENTSKETQLEKALALVLPKEHWANQIPTSSGLIAPHADRKRNIDIAHWDGTNTITIIELKVESDTPVYAAFEIARNALLLCLARSQQTSKSINMVKPEIWNKATKVHLRVLAPSPFYTRFRLGWFEQELNRGIAEFGIKHQLAMSFGFRVFDFENSFNEGLTGSSPYTP